MSPATGRRERARAARLDALVELVDRHPLSDLSTLHTLAAGDDQLSTYTSATVMQADLDHLAEQEGGARILRYGAGRHRTYAVPGYAERIRDRAASAPRQAVAYDAPRPAAGENDAVRRAAFRAHEGPLGARRRRAEAAVDTAGRTLAEEVREEATATGDGFDERRARVLGDDDDTPTTDPDLAPGVALDAPATCDPPLCASSTDEGTPGASLPPEAPAPRGADTEAGVGDAPPTVPGHDSPSHPALGAVGMRADPSGWLPRHHRLRPSRQRRVIDLIAERGPLTGVELETALGVTASTAAANLVRSGHLVRGAPAGARGGRVYDLAPATRAALGGHHAPTSVEPDIQPDVDVYVSDIRRRLLAAHDTISRLAAVVGMASVDGELDEAEFAARVRGVATTDLQAELAGARGEAEDLRVRLVAATAEREHLRERNREGSSREEFWRLRAIAWEEIADQLGQRLGLAPDLVPSVVRDGVLNVVDRLRCDLDLARRSAVNLDGRVVGEVLAVGNLSSPQTEHQLHRRPAVIIACSNEQEARVAGALLYERVALVRAPGVAPAADISVSASEVSRG